jgi:hypothetical protein
MDFSPSVRGYTDKLHRLRQQSPATTYTIERSSVADFAQIGQRSRSKVTVCSGKVTGWSERSEAGLSNHFSLSLLSLQ